MSMLGLWRLSEPHPLGEIQIQIHLEAVQETGGLLGIRRDRGGPEVLCELLEIGGGELHLLDRGRGGPTGEDLGLLQPQLAREHGLGRRSGELDLAGGDGAELIRVRDEEVLEPALDAQSGIGQRLEADGPTGQQLLVFPRGDSQGVDREALGVELSDETSLRIGHPQGRQLDAEIAQVHGTGSARLVRRATDTRVHREPAREPGSGVLRQERLEQAQVEAVRPHRERHRVHRRPGEAHPRRRVLAVSG